MIEPQLLASIVRKEYGHAMPMLDSIAADEDISLLHLESQQQSVVK